MHAQESGRHRTHCFQVALGCPSSDEQVTEYMQPGFGGGALVIGGPRRVEGFLVCPQALA